MRSGASTAGAVAPGRAWHLAGTAALVGVVIFLALWFSNGSYREAFQPTDNDVTALADGSLLLPGARWEDWFTRGHSRFFDTYPEWPLSLTAFARPAFQFLIYLAHFLLGRNWASYLVLNYLGVAAVGAVAYVIARGTLRLGAGLAALAAGLVALSPAVLEFSIWQVGFASESFASAFVGCAFLAIVALRYFACFLCISVAVLTKETAVWAPIAAAMTVLLQPKTREFLLRRILTAAAMLLPLAMWIGLRIAYFGGLGGTYATADYRPIASFLELEVQKLANVHHILIQQHAIAHIGTKVLADRAIGIATALMVLLLLLIWILETAHHTIAQVRQAAQVPDQSKTEGTLLVAFWAVMAFAFYMSLALPSTRYATSVAVFLWPAVVGTIVKHRGRALRLGLVACFVLSLVRTIPLLRDWNSPPDQSGIARFNRASAGMNDALREVPGDIREIYVVTGGSLATASPGYLQVFFDVPAEIIRVVDIRSNCDIEEPIVTVEHAVTDGDVTLRAELPSCASFYFDRAGLASTAVVDGRLRRNDRISYNLVEAHAVEQHGPFEPRVDLGHEIIVHIRPRGPARFLYEPSRPDGAVAWFDIP